MDVVGVVGLLGACQDQPKPQFGPVQEKPKIEQKLEPDVTEPSEDKPIATEKLLTTEDPDLIILTGELK